MIDELIAHLQDTVVSFASVRHAKDQEPVDDDDLELPLLGIFPGDEKTEEDGTDYLTSKMVHMDVHIYIVCGSEELEARKKELRKALMGWSAGPHYTDLSIVAGSIISLKGGIAWWKDIYRCGVTIREEYGN